MQQSKTGDTIKTSINSTFTIRLTATPGTGHRWNFVDSDPKGAIELISSEYEKPSANLDNDSTLQVLTFKALKKGEASFELLYKRPWETDEKAIDKRNYHLSVE